MRTYTVYVTRVTEYEVEAANEDDAKDAVLNASAFNASGVPQVIGEDTQRVYAERKLRDCDIVQVVFEHASGSTSSPYAYEMPDGINYRVGDEVLVPGGYRKQPSLARIVGVGRGGYTGPLKTVEAKVVRPDDEPEPWSASDTEDIGYGRCPDCGVAYQTENSRPCQGMMS